MSEIGSKFGNEVVAAYRGWDQFSIGRAESEQEIQERAITDVDIAPPGEPEVFTSNEQVERRFIELLDTMPEEQLNGDIIRDKLTAALLQMRILAGERVSYKAHVETAMGVSPIWVPAEELLRMRSALDDLLPEGMSYRKEDKEAFEAEFVLTDSKDIDRVLKAGIATGRTIFSRFMEPPKEEVEPEFVNDPRPWSGYVSTRYDGSLYYKLNINPAYKYTEGEALTNSGHEFAGHIFQMGLWRQGINQGEIDPAMGITSVASPESAHVEAIGQLAGILMVDGSPDIVKYAILQDLYKISVYNNISYLANIGTPNKRSLAYAAKWLPQEEEDHLKNVIEARKDPKWLAYLACYLPSLRIVQPVLEMAPAQQKIVLPKIYAPSTMSGLARIVAETKRDKN